MRFNILKIKTIFKLFLRPNGKVDFLNSIPKNSLILDVGCGNNSPLLVKSFLPNSYYVGIDICDYNLGSDSKKILNEESIIESIYSFKRAGACAIVTYFAIDIAKKLKKY